mmetsp:Transcript_4291/g.7521  ORF Transcript_4291/g.7521 Transcript_4291/m.7521 type:complete len:201 (-) Transcript_4291:45-647(-)
MGLPSLNLSRMVEVHWENSTKKSIASWIDLKRLSLLCTATGCDTAGVPFTSWFSCKITSLKANILLSLGVFFLARSLTSRRASCSLDHTCTSSNTFCASSKALTTPSVPASLIFLSENVVSCTTAKSLSARSTSTRRKPPADPASDSRFSATCTTISARAVLPHDLNSRSVGSTSMRTTLPPSDVIAAIPLRVPPTAYAA